MRASLIAVGLVMHVGVATADVELKNDTFETGQLAGFQGGFASGDIGASRFVAPEAGRTLLRVQFLFGGPGSPPQARQITLNVYDDTAGSVIPGTVIYTGNFDVTPSNEAMQEIAITDQVVMLPAQFRVGLQFTHNGVPSIANDDDNTNTAGRNFVFDPVNLGGWVPSSTPGVRGDWIIRAFVSGAGGPGPDGGGPTGGPCDGNGDCPVGEFCDTAAGACTFECRTDTDCGDGSCNSLGQCVGGGGGGCCRADRGHADVGAIALGGLFGMLLLRRRRRCA